QAGDNLSSIATKTNMTTVEIAQLNNLEKPYPIRIGQKLKVSEKNSTNKTTEEKSVSISVYVVQAGDNLISIAAKNNMTTAEIADLNNLKKPYPIRIGQKLKISKNVVVVRSADNKNVETTTVKTETVSKNDNSFLWPVKGDILSNFGNKANGLYNDGINIASSNGSEFRATKSGVIAYVGNELRGYGTIILIKHDSNWISAYAHCSSVKVARGDKVERGQVIGTVGQTGNVDKPQLYFSLRNGREAVDPLKYLKNS
ncbi:MAG: M23 family metallopeptidase, partial [Rickettsiales bacterium]|nr:M23 family metallopeptidase [Rickettsiales bacterium]